MKKFFARFLAAVLMAVVLLSAVACTKRLSGSYASSELLGTTYTFDGDKVTVSSDLGIALTGTYEIEKDTITFSYKVMSVTTSNTVSFEKKGSSIFLDGVEYVKQ